MCKGLTIRPLDTDIPNPAQILVLAARRGGHMWRHAREADQGAIVAYYPRRLEDQGLGMLVRFRKYTAGRGNEIFKYYLISIIIAFTIIFTITSSFRIMVLFLLAFITGFITGRRMAIARMHF